MLLDYAIAPAFVLWTVAATWMLLERIPPFWVTGLVIGPLAIVAAILERARPERSDHRALDQPLAVDAAHYFLSYQLGYVLGLGACAAMGVAIRATGCSPIWPSSLPLAAQVVLAILLAEGVAYWQHRLLHRVPRLWRFHALHHSGKRLNLVRAGRFHFVDGATATFMTFVPLVLLGAPDAMVTWVATLTGTFGVLGHANMRVRTPAWLSWVVCTPALHRHHHSRVLRESDRNFGTVTPLFDVLFRTYEPVRAPGPEQVGIADDPVPRGFSKQLLSPFRRG
jgi:sterol desaturase/sphingolipid hydroxylase (fatty acid hydroxylase superfamily)